MMATQTSAPPANSRPLPQVRMMSRVLTILYILLCLEMGIALFFFPWVSYWTKNFFVSHYPWVAAVARNYFVRGAISGIGLADIWLAFYEIWRLCRRVAAAPRPLP